MVWLAKLYQGKNEVFMKSFFVLMSIVCFAIGSSAKSFTIDKYKQQCGGKVYSNCDAADVNQKTIYEEARTIAKKEKKKLMLILGADWCPACVIFSKMVASDPNAEKLHSQVVIVDINGMLKSTKDLKKSLKINNMAFPQGYIIDPISNEISQILYPSYYSNVSDLLAAFGTKKVKVKKETVTGEKQLPQYTGELFTSSLMLSIGFTDDFGTSSFISKPKTDAEKLVNQGVAALHLYHYLDSYRSFKEAERKNPDLIMPYVGQILSVLQISSSEDDEYHVTDAFEKIKERSVRKPLSKIESVWVEFAKSFHMFHSSNYLVTPGQKVKTMEEAFQDILSVDKSNLDGHSLVTWLSRSVLEDDDAKKVLENVLKSEPNNIGAHHGLLHFAEGDNDMKKADLHAPVLARLAPNSAHAVHMYAHTLPQKGRWAEALELFKKAHLIHLQWAKKHGIDVNQDWHYAHNLDLMAAVYLGLGDFEKAKTTWMQATSDYRAVSHYLWLTVTTDNETLASDRIALYENKGWRNFVKPMKLELTLSRNNQNEYIEELSRDSESEFKKMLKRVLLLPENSSRDETLASDMLSYFAKEFKSGGFDGWSNAYINLLRVKRIGKILNHQWISEEFAALEFAAQSGSLCGAASVEQKSNIPCLK